ncbi:hypothetical protein PAPYR_1206 [Paratrimastix pyriformis]|uniref:Uncharacterized protein n=1 Tax=Paratrimastix pyriformis TaxID=342808 RepID=A0ABQ8USD8_9EUKA|nr:hypothetical protein PAPYR_1206 [Paratrimastix pyriformis]
MGFFASGLLPVWFFSCVQKEPLGERRNPAVMSVPLRSETSSGRGLKIVEAGETPVVVVHRELPQSEPYWKTRGREREGLPDMWRTTNNDFHSPKSLSSVFHRDIVSPHRRAPPSDKITFLPPPPVESGPAPPQLTPGKTTVGPRLTTNRAVYDHPAHKVTPEVKLLMADQSDLRSTAVRTLRQPPSMVTADPEIVLNTYTSSHSHETFRDPKVTLAATRSFVSPPSATRMCSSQHLRKNQTTAPIELPARAPSPPDATLSSSGTAAREATAPPSPSVNLFTTTYSALHESSAGQGRGVEVPLTHSHSHPTGRLDNSTPAVSQSGMDTTYRRFFAVNTLPPPPPPVSEGDHPSP